MSQIPNEITQEPIQAEVQNVPYFAMVFEDATDRVLWVGGPYANPACANKEAERQAILLKYNGNFH